VFLPCHIERRRWSDRVRQVERPFFPGYLFCRCPARTFGKIVTAPGVIRIVGNGEGPEPVPDQQVEAIRRIAESRVEAQPCPFIQTGQRVKVQLGPLRGTEGIVLAMRNARRLVVSVPLLRRSVAVEMDPAWVGH
jgi:transcription antitermination factor NusG